MIDIEKQVLPFVRKTETCWFWEKGHNKWGRPYFRNKIVYRLLYAFFRKPLTKGKVLDHVVCDNPACVNPWHLEETTQKKNLDRAGVSNNLGNFLGSKELGSHLGSYLGKADRERNALGQFTGG